MRAITIMGFLMVGACTPLSGSDGEPPPMTTHTVSPAATQAAPSLSTVIDLAAASRGRAIALGGCASCHAIETAGTSPLAIAPPFREIVQRWGSDDLAAAFERGLVTTHPAMPAYVFRANEIYDLTAYLDTLRNDAGRQARSSSRSGKMTGTSRIP